MKSLSAYWCGRGFHKRGEAWPQSAKRGAGGVCNRLRVDICDADSEIPFCGPRCESSVAQAEWVAQTKAAGREVGPVTPITVF
jgi:hypothetical protein